MTEVEQLQDLVQRLHGVQSKHIRSEPVREGVHGTTVWEGVVEVFTVRGNTRAALAYAWSHETDGGGRQYVAVLGIPPINSAHDAVQAHIAAEAKKPRP